MRTPRWAGIPVRDSFQLTALLEGGKVGILIGAFFEDEISHIFQMPFGSF